MTSAWAHYVNSNNLLQELRALTRRIPFSSECLDEAKAQVVADPASVRSWNYCWLVLVKIEKESVPPRCYCCLSLVLICFQKSDPQTRQNVSLKTQHLGRSPADGGRCSKIHQCSCKRMDSRSTPASEALGQSPKHHWQLDRWQCHGCAVSFISLSSRRFQSSISNQLKS